MEQPKKLEKLISMMEFVLTKEEFVDAFEKVVEAVKEAEKKQNIKLDSTIAQLEATYQKTITALEDNNQSRFSKLKDLALEQVNKIFISSNISSRFNTIETENRKLVKELDIKIKEVNKAIDSASQLEDGKDADEQKIVDEVLAQIPPYPEQKEETALDIRNKLESLTEDARLNIKYISGLDTILEKLGNEIKKSKPMTTGITGRELFKDIDISDQLDGVTKTFNIPAVYNIISVSLSSFPNVLRKTVDFTYTGTTITFTSEIDASTSLASGQTCVLTVVCS